MTVIEHRAGARAIIVRPKDEDAKRYAGKSCRIDYYMGTSINGNYYKVTIDGTDEKAVFFTSELDVTPVLTKGEEIAKLRAELEKLEAEIKAEAEAKARNDIKALGAGTLIELGVDDDTDYVVKVGPDKWHWFSKNGDPLVHHETTNDQEVIDRIALARDYGYHEIFPADAD